MTALPLSATITYHHLPWSPRQVRLYPSFALVSLWTQVGRDLDISNCFEFMPNIPVSKPAWPLRAVWPWPSNLTSKCQGPHVYSGGKSRGLCLRLTTENVKYTVRTSQVISWGKSMICPLYKKNSEWFWDFSETDSIERSPNVVAFIVCMLFQVQ